jgi:hypothetical protein
VSRDDYPVSYRIMCLKDGIVLKLRYQHATEELVMVSGEADLLGTQLIAAARDRKSQEGVIGAAAAGPAEPQRPCEGFRWIAQTFRSCDRCGLPFWEHSHQERIKPGASPFGPDAFGLVPITAEDAAACKRKWGES